MMEGLVWCAARAGITSRAGPWSPGSIFVLRNNDIGDLLVITPLFEALHKRFPAARIVAGVGDWNAPVLAGNPHVSEVVPVNAPWHNKFIQRQGLSASLKYVYTSSEAKALARRRFNVGLDILGSPFGALLMLRCGIPWRLGVKGYAGGHSATQQCVRFNAAEHVGHSALRFAELLGANEMAALRPQIFLSPEEEETAERAWQEITTHSAGFDQRIVIGPGGGFAEKCWPLPHWSELVQLLSAKTKSAMAIVGGGQDKEAGAQLASIAPRIRNLAGSTGLRETFALVAKADLVLCNSSMLMHAAAAFAKPAVVLLGDFFPSASAHAAQWSHEGSSLVLGKDADRKTIYSPAEAFEVIQRTLPRQLMAS